MDAFLLSGMAGAIYYLSELSHPEASCFPAFELWPGSWREVVERLRWWCSFQPWNNNWGDWSQSLKSGLVNKCSALWNETQKKDGRRLSDLNVDWSFENKSRSWTQGDNVELPEDWTRPACDTLLGGGARTEKTTVPLIAARRCETCTLPLHAHCDLLVVPHLLWFHLRVCVKNGWKDIYVM